MLLHHVVNSPSELGRNMFATTMCNCAALAHLVAGVQGLDDEQVLGSETKPEPDH